MLEVAASSVVSDTVASVLPGVTMRALCIGGVVSAAAITTGLGLAPSISFPPPVDVRSHVNGYVPGEDGLTTLPIVTTIVDQLDTDWFILIKAPCCPTFQNDTIVFETPFTVTLRLFSE